MRAFIAATLVSVAVAAPAYGGYAEEPTTSVAAIPLYTPPTSTPCPTAPATHAEEHVYPETAYEEVHTSTTPVGYPEVPSSVSYVAGHVETPCSSSTTLTVTLPHSATLPYETAHPTTTAYPTAPVYHTSATAPYPTHSVETHVPVHYPATSVEHSLVAPYPSVPAVEYPAPVGTGYPSPAPPAGTGTAAPVKPTTYPEFVGAASNVQAASFLAGVGAFAALFL